MRLPLPRSLSAQTLVVLACTLIVSHFIGVVTYSLDRREAVVATEAHDFGERVIGMVNLLRHLPADWRDEIVRESDGRTFHVELGLPPDLRGQDLDPNLSRNVAEYLERRLPGSRPEDILVEFTDVPFIPRRSFDDDVMLPSGDPAGTVEAQDNAGVFLHISIRLRDDTWLNFVGGMPGFELVWLLPASAYFLIVTVGVACIAMWLVFRVTAPLTAFARAADRLGKDIRMDPLPLGGPTEVVQATHAFNAMQERLRRLVENRTQVLAALSHDLKTPVTLLRLRVELMDKSADQARLLDTLAEMEQMIASVLEFAKSTLLDEAPRVVDISALVASICENMEDSGLPVELEPSARINCLCRRTGLKRAVTNFIDNAIKYGGRACLRVTEEPGTVVIEIRDDGPGIPEDQHDVIFMPFYRLDNSRSSEAGGTGLGLSIAQAIVHGHGGRIELSNGVEGGLLVRVILPT